MSTTSEARRPEETGDRGQTDGRRRKLTSSESYVREHSGDRQGATDSAAGVRNPLDGDRLREGHSVGEKPETASHQGPPLIERVAQVMDEYSGAAEQAFGDARALFDSCAILSRGLQHWQHTYLGLSEQALGKLSYARLGLLRCGSVLEIAELQRVLALELMNRAVASNLTLLQIAVQIGRDAAGPLRARAEAKRGA